MKLGDIDGTITIEEQDKSLAAADQEAEEINNINRSIELDIWHNDNDGGPSAEEEAVMDRARDPFVMGHGYTAMYGH